jgi:hypothetical protein
MVAIMREADRDLVSAVAKQHGISEQPLPICPDILHVTGPLGRPCILSSSGRPLVFSVQHSVYRIKGCFAYLKMSAEEEQRS